MMDSNDLFWKRNNEIKSILNQSRTQCNWRKTNRQLLTNLKSEANSIRPCQYRQNGNYLMNNQKQLTNHQQRQQQQHQFKAPDPTSQLPQLESSKIIEYYLNGLPSNNVEVDDELRLLLIRMELMSDYMELNYLLSLKDSDIEWKLISISHFSIQFQLEHVYETLPDLTINVNDQKYFIGNYEPLSIIKIEDLHSNTKYTISNNLIRNPLTIQTKLLPIVVFLSNENSWDIDDENLEKLKFIKITSFSKLSDTDHVCYVHWTSIGTTQSTCPQTDEQINKFEIFINNQLIFIVDNCEKDKCLSLPITKSSLIALIQYELAQRLLMHCYHRKELNGVDWLDNEIPDQMELLLRINHPQYSSQTLHLNVDDKEKLLELSIHCLTKLQRILLSDSLLQQILFDSKTKLTSLDFILTIQQRYEIKRSSLTFYELLKLKKVTNANAKYVNNLIRLKFFFTNRNLMKFKTKLLEEKKKAKKSFEVSLTNKYVYGIFLFSYQSHKFGDLVQVCYESNEMVYRLKNDEELKIPQHVIGIVEYGDSDIEQVKEKIEEKKTNLDRSFSDMCIYQLEKLNEHFDGEELPKCLRINRKNRSFNHSKYLSTSSLSLNETMPLPIVNRMNLKKL